MHAEEIEIKIAQGSKPGEGGQLPGHKVTELIARLRHAQPGVALISPPPHHDIYSIEDLAQLIYDLKRVNPRAAIGVKLVSECGVGTIAAGVAKAYADYIVIAGHAGGTGASPLSSIKYAGNPWELGLAEAQQVLLQNGLRGRVRLRCDGGLAHRPRHPHRRAAGSRRVCLRHRGSRRSRLRHGAAMPSQHLSHRHRHATARSARQVPWQAGACHPLLRGAHRATSRSCSRRSACPRSKPPSAAPICSSRSAPPADSTWRLPGASLARAMYVGRAGAIAAPPIMPPSTTPGSSPPLPLARPATFSLEATIANKHRTLGARLAGELVWHGLHHKDTPLNFKMKGVAGQSFGAFAVPGMQLVLEGIANDFVGKGLCGGELILRGQGRAARESELHVILGNVALYGATSGSLFAAGRAGERFAVRNSGALAIVEGVGDHGCEYMTGGLVAVLGSTGLNFGAGMTGGLAWVFDEDGTFLSQTRYHTGFLAPEPSSQLDETAVEELRQLIELHAEKTASTRAHWILSDWANLSARFVRLTPLPQA